MTQKKETLYIQEISQLKSELEIKKERLYEYMKAWDRQQGIIKDLSSALTAQESLSLNNLRDRFTIHGKLNSISPSELVQYMRGLKK